MHLHPLDTSAEARELQSRAHERLGPDGRLKAALELSEAVRTIRLTGLRSQMPGASESDLVRRFVVEAHGIQAELGLTAEWDVAQKALEAGSG